MRSLFSLLLLTVFLLASCAQSTPEPLHTPTAPAEPPTLSPTLPNPTPTDGPAATSALTFQQAMSLPLDRALIAFESSDAQKNQTLFLADPAESTNYEFSFPATARYATPFLAGLSPDTRYFVYFEGGQIESLYDIEHLRTNTPDLVLHVLSLQSGKVIFSIPLLSPSYPQDLVPIAETIQDEYNSIFSNASFEDAVAATKEMLLDYIRSVSWSPDGSLLAFASQNPGPSSDLYFFSPESGTSRRVTTDPGHVLKSVWAPDSSVLVMETSLFDRHAREDTTYLLSRDGSLRGSFTSQIWWFHNWHDPTTALLYGSTDAGDYFELKTLSADDGTISMLWEGSWGDIAFSDDLSSFLVSSVMPAPPAPPHPGLFLGSRDDGSLVALSKKIGWEVTHWGSERFAFAASSFEGGTIGVTPDGEIVTIDDEYWRFDASPNGSYLAGYNRDRPGNVPGILPGLRIFDGSGQLQESIADISITCVRWNAASTALAYQAESRLYLWDAASGSTRQISDQLNQEECAFKWVRDTP